jgi:deoxyribonuclease-4
MPSDLLGAHVSIAGGLHLAVERAAAAGCGALQIFSRNNTQWASKPLSKKEIQDWKAARSRHPMIPMVHGSYLINLATADPALRRRSLAAFLAETRRCEALEIPYLIFHPGAHMGAGEAAGLERIARALDEVIKRLGTGTVTLLLENTAGQGTSLGHRLEHLAAILSSVERPERLGVCLDTCHLLAAGYDFRDDAGYKALLDTIERTVGVERVRAFHLNDSKRELGARVDRHEHIGRGHVGSRAFRLLLTDPRFRRVPKVIETPKANDMDRKNLARLRRLARP